MQKKPALNVVTKDSKKTATNCKRFMVFSGACGMFVYPY